MSDSSDKSDDNRGEKPSTYSTSEQKQPEAPLNSHGRTFRSPFHRLAISYAGKTRQSSRGRRLPYLIFVLVVVGISIIFLRGKERDVDLGGGVTVAQSHGDMPGESSRGQSTENEALHSPPRLPMAKTTGELKGGGDVVPMAVAMDVSSTNSADENNAEQPSSLPTVGRNNYTLPNHDRPDLQIEVNQHPGVLEDDIFTSGNHGWRIPEREPDLPVRIVQSGGIEEQPIESQFEDDGLLSSVDPKAQYITLLEYRDINLGEVPVETQYLAIVAMNELIGRHSQIARNSLETLNAYLDAADLREAFVEYLSNSTPSRQAISFQGGLQMATAYVMSPIGHEDYRYRLVGVDDSLKERVTSTLMQQCMKEWPELLKHRTNIITLGSFLESVNKVDGYFAWAEGYAQRQLAERRAQMELARAGRDHKEEMNRLNILEIQRERDARSHEIRMKRMEYAMKLKQEAIRSDAAVRIARYMRNWGYYPSSRVGSYYTNRAGVTYGN